MKNNFNLKSEPYWEHRNLADWVENNIYHSNAPRKTKGGLAMVKPKATILFADNDPDFSKARVETLEAEGYHVLLATNPTEARRLLEQNGLDLAILDIRLLDDDDKKDTSGLTIAKEVAPAVPKIIMTNFPSVNAVRDALKPQLGGLPPAIDFLNKKDGLEAMVASVRRSIAVHVEKSPKHAVLDLSEQLEKDYEEARRQAVFIHRVRLVLIIIGGVVISGGAIGVIRGQAAVGILGIMSGTIVEALAGLFSKFAEDANKRMDRYHKELLELYKEQK
jgi:CheY-like chemotaxis protein